MKRIFANLALAIGVSSLFVSTPLSAQDNSAVADVPFAFVVANQTLPAGKYNVSQIQYGSPVFSLRNEQGDALFVQLGVRTQGQPEHPSLTFACKGHACLLAKITPPNSSVAFGLIRNENKPQKLELVSMISIKLKAR
jgi:hypothetical protein